MAASVDYLARRYTGFAKDNGWLADGDPLVIDLDGDGIETTGLADSRAYFDVDGDFFREKTGWLKGDDGFLVLDANANGRIDATMPRGTRSIRCLAAANHDDTWRGAAFRFGMEQAL